MSSSAIPTPRIREFLPQEYKITVWSKLKPYYNELLKRPIHSIDALERWVLDETELNALFEEELHRRYITKLTNKNDARANDAYEYILHGIGKPIKEMKRQLRVKLVNEALFKQLDKQRFGTYLQSVQLQNEIFRKENKALYAELNFLLDSPTDTRNTDSFFDRILELKTQIASNVAFDNYRDYRFKELGRTAYTSEDCHELHESIADLVVAVISQLPTTQHSAFSKTRAFTVPSHLKKEQLTDTAIHFLNNIHPTFGACLRKIQAVGHIKFIDGESDIQECISLPLSGIPYIYSNQNGRLPEIIEFFKTCGIAIQQMVSTRQSLGLHQQTSSEMQKLITGFFELLVIENAPQLFTEKKLAHKIKQYLITQSLFAMCQAAMIDRFEHWLYRHPNHTNEERQHALQYMHTRFTGPDNNRSKDSLLTHHDYNNIYKRSFQSIETAIAQIGAFALWKSYRTAPTQTIENLIEVLKEGSRLNLQEIYHALDIPLDFSNDYIGELMTFIGAEIQV